MAESNSGQQLRTVKSEQYAKEFKDAANETMFNAVHLKSPNDRIRVCEWLRKLKELRNDKYEEVKMKNEYMQYLKMSLTGEYKILTKPFSSAPPKQLVPFAECIANKTCDAIPELPRSGPIQPILCHKSEDNRAFITIKRTPDNGVICYMAVAPEPISLKE
ncbi:hypothetical protein PVAND_005644 [Polypedilum vanderplanki]|uniref:DUF4485 domain-containing protein n=1 Tax=Polypedilum vanderplanki TaxID=319348 RepID=A0A9J6C1K1_POLVA|nr:hypothetical protein PVAND_005644 [Polypedilum vanderplanki]